MKKDKKQITKLQEKSRIPLVPLTIFLLVKMLGYGAEIVNEEIIGKEKNGNGIELSATEIMINKGTIRGRAIEKGGNTKEDSDASISSIGNGVHGNVKANVGLIVGIAEVTGGNVSSDTLTATATSSDSANGVYGDVITNNGVMSGYQILKGGTPDRRVNSEVATKGSSNGVRGIVTENNGVILGYGKYYGNKSNVEVIESSNGVSGALTKNNGVLSGNAILSGTADNAAVPYNQKADATSISSGNGFMMGPGKQTEDTVNDGVISGYVSSTPGKSNGMKDFEKIEYSGNGISKSTTIDSDIFNRGVIKGSQSAIAAPSIAGQVYNLGILAGREIYSNGVELIENDMHSKDEKELVAIKPKVEYNQGIYIKLKSETLNGKETGKAEIGTDGNPVIEEIKIGTGGNDGKDIINGDVNGNVAKAQTIVGNVDTYLNASSLISSEKVIINGSGMQKGALVIDKDITLQESVVNGYNTAVYVEGNNKFTAENTIFNGGGLENDVAVIRGDSGDNSIKILGDSIVNGSIALEGGTNSLSIGNTVIMNGDIYGGTGNDTLNLGDSRYAFKNESLNIFGKINSFETINTSGKVTLFETAHVSGASDINIVDGDLVLRVDPSIKVDEKVTGHALYGNKGTVTSSGGNLVLGLNGIGEGTTIAMGDTTIDKNSSGNVKVNSLVLDAQVSSDGKEINVKVLDSIPDPDPKPNPEPSLKVDSVLYQKLDQGYKSIVSAGEIGKLANTTLLDDKTYNESLGGLLSVLDQLYANNPYSYTIKSTRDNLKLFEDSMSYLTIKPKKDEWITQGRAIYTGIQNDNKASGKNHYGFDTGHRNYKTTTDTSGGLATFEYGLSDKTSIGGIIGGSNQDINFKGSNRTKANSLYLGTFAKTEVDNFKFTGGLGYQYTGADTDRKISNGYDSFKTSDKYNINSFNVFAEAKYVYEGTQNWSIEPKTRVSYYYVDQDKVDEGYDPGQLSIKVDEAKSKTVDLEIGVDVVKKVYLPKTKLSNIFYAGVVNTLGDTSKDLKGHVIGKDKDGSKFDIEGTELPKTSGKVAYNLELEQDNGMIYSAGVSLKFSEDYNRAVTTFVGIGYKY